VTLRFASVAVSGVWLDHRFEPGLTALVGHPDAAARAIVELACGLRLPERGVVSLAGKAPALHPELRAAIASLLPEEPAPRDTTVLYWMERSRALRLAARACPDAETCLDRLGLAELGRRTTDAITPRECRAAMLALACGLEDPAAMVLWEPLTIAGVDRAELSRVLDERARNAPVLFTTTDPQAATSLGATTLHLVGGRLLNAPARPATVTYRVTVEGSSELASSLLAEPNVLRVAAPHDAHTLEVTGVEAADLSSTILRCIVRSDAKLVALTPTYHDLDTLQASARGSADAAYNAAQQAPAIQPQQYPVPGNAR